MTSLNNLAVLLDEVVDQIQQQMMQSSGQCQKPGLVQAIVVIYEADAKTAKRAD